MGNYETYLRNKRNYLMGLRDIFKSILFHPGVLSSTYAQVYGKYIMSILDTTRKMVNYA